MMMTQLNPLEVKKVLGHMIANNKMLAKTGKKPVAIEVEGNAGIGKTSVISQVSREEDCYFVRLNLAEITLEDLVGYPVKEYEMKKDEEEGIWVVESAVEHFITRGYNHINNSRMNYALPKWIVNKQDKPVILLLDDFTRGNQSLMQATMTLIDEGGYVSWSLPEGSTVVLSTNPDNGEFMVTSLDAAQKSRFLGVKMKFDVDTWAEWAESYNLDGRCINFILKHPEVVEGTKEMDDKGNKLVKANIRLWTKYFDTLSGVADFEDADSFKLLMDLGGCLPREHMQLFSAFIKNKLDKLPTSQEIIEGEEKRVKALLNDIIGEAKKNTFRADLASVLCKRLVNFCQYNPDYFTGQDKDDKIIRVGDILFDWELFGKDLVQLAARKVVKIDFLKKKLLSKPAFLKHYTQ